MGTYSKHDYRRVPFSIAEAWAKGYLTVSLLNHELIHLTVPEPYASPLCGKTGTTYDRIIVRDDAAYAQGRFCKQCVDIAERKRIAERSKSR
jgi:hypothetical protein